MANYLAAAVVSTGDVIGIYQEYDGSLRLQWVNTCDPDELPIEFSRKDLDTVMGVLADANAALERSPNEKGGAA